jgi:hypothetical protein
VALEQNLSLLSAHMEESHASQVFDLTAELTAALSERNKGRGQVAALLAEAEAAKGRAMRQVD